MMGEVPVEALRGASLSVEEGEFVALTGPSGSGKTTLLNIVAGLDRPTRGRAVVLGRDLSRMGGDELARFRLENVGVVFQFYNLLEELTCVENVALPLIAAGVPAGEALERAARLLERVGLSHRLRARPASMSGGEQQRAAVARALVTSPRLLLADEPTGNLDSASKRGVMELLRGAADEGRTVLVMTHDPEMASYADRVLRVRDGRVEPP
ncbi:MAG: macrolide ABC transporter ATP-binding protein [Thermoproteota archaeon]|nr:MAG: macrolide ABC transporter ATP-binding protein [Candidatus Korarchaeota archaeon]